MVTGGCSIMGLARSYHIHIWLVLQQLVLWGISISAQEANGMDCKFNLDPASFPHCGKWYWVNSRVTNRPITRIFFSWGCCWRAKVWSCVSVLCMLLGVFLNSGSSPCQFLPSQSCLFQPPPKTLHLPNSPTHSSSLTHLQPLPIYLMCDTECWTWWT